MKKLVSTIFLVSFLFGEMTLFADPGTDYGSWSTAPGWPGLNYRVKRNSSSPGDQTFTWWVQFDNTYNQKITFSYNLTPPNSAPPTLTDGMTLGAGRENADWFIVGFHDSVQVWVGQVTLGDGTTANTGNSQSSTSSSQQNSIQQEQAQLQQQQQQAVQQSLQQQQAALQQQIADKRAALQEQKQELETKRQQIINDYEAKAQTYQALGNAVQNAANQIADYLQQQEQQKEAREAQEQEQQQEQDIQNQERQLQDQLDQLQQQQTTDTGSNGQYVNNVPNTADQEENSGWNYLNGIGVNQDYTQALYLFRQAAAQNNAAAQCNLGWMYLNGKGVAQDYGQAWNWFQASAAQGNAPSENDLGWMYQNGEGVAQDYDQAMNWFNKAAAQGNTDAELSLASMYLNGQGINQDYSQARDWYQKAAAQGNMKGKVWSLYANGLLQKSENALDAAIEDFYQAVQLQRDFSEANSQLEAVLNAKAATLSGEAAQDAPRTFEQLQEAKRIAYERQQDEIHRNFLKQFAGTWRPDSPKANGTLRLWIADSGQLQGSGEFKFKIRVAGEDDIDVYRYNCAINGIALASKDIDSVLNGGQLIVPIQGTFQCNHSHRKRYLESGIETHFILTDFVEVMVFIYGSPILFPVECLAAHRTSDTFDGQLTICHDGTLSFAQAGSTIVQLTKVSD